MYRNIGTIQRTFLLKHVNMMSHYPKNVSEKFLQASTLSSPDHNDIHGIQGINVEASIPPALSSDLVKC